MRGPASRNTGLKGPRLNRSARWGLAVLAAAVVAVCAVHLPGAARAMPALLLFSQHSPCSNCHQVHTAPGLNLTKEAVREVLCQTCHSPTGGAPVREVHKNAAGGKLATCTDCHSPHDYELNSGGVANLALIRAAIATPHSGNRGVRFESRGLDAGQPAAHSFADGDTVYDGICEVCHTQTAYHRNSSEGNHAHEAGRTCTQTCHRHDAGFVPSGTCTDCHSTPQDNGDGIPPGGRRAVVGEFSRLSHHLQVPAPDSLTAARCQVCHDQSRHQQGAVRLWNVDYPGNLDSVIVLTGNPAADSIQAAKLTRFCLACHDANGANGNLTPLGDGVTRPLIEAAAWNAAAHATGGRGCFGNGISGCHATGHGSLKRKLLAPPDVAATPPANAEQEEGFCFACHDSNGPAATDVQAAFSRSIRWVTAPVGAAANTRLNDRHDVQYTAQSTSGAKIECTDCHDPHRDTAVQPWKTDPDPSDGRVPGTGQVMAGVSFRSEFCLDCHDGSYPATVTPPSTPLTNVRSTHVTDAMGGATGSPTLKSGYGWAAGDVMNCEACHKAHVSGNLFHAVDTVYSKSGTTPVPPDGGGSYAITDNNTKNTAVNGWKWCNTCHTGSMGTTKTNCFSCHYHGSRF